MHAVLGILLTVVMTRGSIVGAADAAGATCSLSPTLVPTCGVLLGISTDKIHHSALQGIEAHEVAIGRQVDLIHKYHRWATAVPSADETTLLQSGRRKLLWSWQANREDGSIVKWADIAAGKQDAVIDREAASLKSFGRPVIVNFENEPDATFHSCTDPTSCRGNKGKAEDYRNAFRHIHDRFAADGVKNAVYAFVVMGVSSHKYRNLVKALYPGDTYTDWVFFDPYNGPVRKCTNRSGNSTFKTFVETVTPWYSWAQANLTSTKPYGLAEYGSIEDRNNSQGKAAFFAGEGLALTDRTFPNLKAVSYFDHDSSCNYHLTTSKASMSAYAAMANLPGLATTTPAS